MLRLIAVAAIAIVSITAQAQAGEVSERCGTQTNWQSLKCALAVGNARRNERDAADYEVRAKQADRDGKSDVAKEYRARAAYEAAQVEAFRKRYPVR